jgi:hypothetical protein
MNSRRIALSLGAAAGGALAAAFLQPALAFADDYTITPDPTETETFTAIGGQPPFDQAVAGLQLFDTDDLTTGNTGSFDGMSLNDVAAVGQTNQEILVNDGGAFHGGGNALTAPPTGSFFDTTSYGNDVENQYTDLVGTGANGTNTITDTFVTPFGNINIPTTFDATEALQAADFTYPSTSAAFAGYSYVPDSSFEEDVNSIGGLLPFDQSVSGTQSYDVDDPTGAYVGGFDGVSYNDVNAWGQTNQEILVTAYGFGAGHGGGGHVGGFGGGGLDVPPAGSIFDTDNYGNGFENVYADFAATDTNPQTITDTFVTPLGDINIPTTFDAATALNAAEFTFPTGSAGLADYSYVPDSDNPEGINAISGQPLVDQTVSGTQVYDVTDPTGTTIGEFDGVSTHEIDALGLSNQEILVTTNTTGVIGTDEPTPGSFFDTLSGYGYENIYSDIVAANGATNTVTDTLVTPLGDLNIPISFDATAALTAAEFLFPTG